MYILKRVCSYCGLKMKDIETDCKPREGFDTSHGICDGCLEIERAKIAAMSPAE